MKTIERLNRLFLRILYYPVIFSIKPLDIIAHSIYMKLISRLLKQCGVKVVGNPRYISSDVYLDSFNSITLGKEIVISKKVVFLTHDYSITTAFVALGKRPKTDAQVQGNIIIGNNVFIGLGTTLLPGTTIGDNVIVGACSVVKGAIPSNSVIAGNPAKVLMTIDEYYKRKQRNIQNLDIKYD